MRSHALTVVDGADYCANRVPSSHLNTMQRPKTNNFGSFVRAGVKTNVDSARVAVVSITRRSVAETVRTCPRGLYSPRRLASLHRANVHMKTKLETGIISSRHRNTLVAALVVGALSISLQSSAFASSAAVSRDQAKRIHDRLTGTPATDAWLTANAGKDALTVAKTAINPTDTESSGFYNATLKNFAMPWTNRDQTVFAPLNDYVATVIGMVRDDVPFNTLLSADLIYTAGGGTPAYSNKDNNSYQYLEDNNIDMRSATNLMSQKQTAVTGLPAAAVAGIITTRAAAQAFFIAGTNRAMFRFTMLNHLCHDMEQMQETSRAPDRIRQDVSRSPGGDSRGFLNGCIGCHGGMDPMAQAFAYYNFDDTQGMLVYTPGAVQTKYGINSDNFKQGYVTPDDHWNNRWREGPNKALGFSSSVQSSGNGAATLGTELGNSNAFAQCQVEKVFKAVCFRAPGNSADRAAVSSIVSSFKSNNYSLREVFAETAVYCMGDE